MGGFTKATRLIADVITSGRGVVYSLKTAVTRAGVRTQSPHITGGSVYFLLSVK